MPSVPAGGNPVATLTMNPAVDLSFEVDRLAPTRKLRCSNLRRDAGGGGINVARVIARLGGEVLAVFPAGGCTGDRLCALLDAEGVSRLTISAASETREDFTAAERASGEQYRFVLPGGALQDAEWRAVLARLAATGANLLVASGSLPPGAPPDLYGRLARMAKGAGARLVLDAPAAALAPGLAAGVWLAKPNLEELEAVAGAGLPDLGCRLSACRDLMARGAAQIVALSMGAEGAILVTSEGGWIAKGAPITPISTVGAGDSFVGALVHALSRDLGPADSLRLAAAAGAAALLAPGTQLCRKADVQRLERELLVSAL